MDFTNILAYINFWYFVYSFNGEYKGPFTTTLNPFIIETKMEGIYELVSFSDADEIGGISGQALVTVFQPPVADFHLTSSDTLSILNPTSDFIDDSYGNIVSWQWNFGDNSAYEYDQLVEHTFEPISSLYTVSLVISDENNCKDTTYKNIFVKDEFWIYIPNSFTPDDDQINDKFCISYNGIRLESFSFAIYDRFSNLVYSTNNITDLDCNNGWDGTYQDTGNPLIMNTYIYEINYKDFEGWKHQDFGTIFLVR